MKQLAGQTGSKMNAAITILQYEHGIIRQVVDVLGVLLQRENIAGNYEHLVQIQEFQWNFTDHFHHQKEERFIFPEAEKMSEQFANDAEILKKDHEKARDILRSMDSSLSSTMKNNSQESFRDAGMRFVKHITDHIQYEEDTFFPFFEKHVAPEKSSLIKKHFKEFLEMSFGGKVFYAQNENFSFGIQNEVMGAGYFAQKSMS